MPAFDMSAKLTNLNLVNINNILRAYAKFDVQKGKFSVYTEIAAKNNRITGYVEPFIKNLDIIDPIKEKKKPFKQRFFESMLELGTLILRNPENDQLATRIIIEGKLNKPNISVYQIMGDALANAFEQALIPGLNHSVSLDSVGKGHKKNFLEKLFGKHKKGKKKKKKK
jgi:hypothetical protein